MTTPNIFTIYFQEKHQKFLLGFEWFGTELALIGMGNQEKTTTAGEPSRLSCGTTIIQQIYDYGWGCSIGTLERHTPNALYLPFYELSTKRIHLLFKYSLSILLKYLCYSLLLIVDIHFFENIDFPKK